MRAVNSEARMPTAIVFGAAGFVGRNVCTVLRAARWSIVGVVRAGDVPDDRILRLDAVHTDIDTLVASLAAHDPTVVVNAAGALWGATDDDQMTNANVTLVARLVQAVAALPNPPRLVHIGSAYEYGSHPGFARLSETLPARPTSRYAQTKLAATDIVTKAVADGRIDATVLRIATSIGPFAPRLSLLGGLAHQLAASPAVLELPPIDGVRDLIDVRDVADAVRSVASASAVPPVVNIGTGVAVALTDAVDLLIQIAGSAAQIVRSPAPPVRRDAGVGPQPLDISLARRQLGWSPARTLTDALHAMWDNVREQRASPMAI